MSYDVCYNNDNIGIERLSNGKFRIPNFVKKLSGSYAGFNPKPSYEVVLVVMKPLEEKSYTNQALCNGHGVTWLDNCRIPFKGNVEDEPAYRKNRGKCNSNTSKEDGTFLDGFNNVALQDKGTYNNEGRFPANLLCSDDILNDGNLIRGKPYLRNTKDFSFKPGQDSKGKFKGNDQRDEYGSFSRYFDLDAWYTKHIENLPESVQKTYPFILVPKAPKSQKDKGCKGLYKLKDNISLEVKNEIEKELNLIGEQE